MTGHADTVVMTDGELADSILRKIAHEVAHGPGCILIERYEHGEISGLIDSTWFDLTPEEATYLERLEAEQDA